MSSYENQHKRVLHGTEMLKKLILLVPEVFQIHKYSVSGVQRETYD